MNNNEISGLETERCENKILQKKSDTPLIHKRA